MGEVRPPPKSRMAELEERIYAHRNWVEPLVGRTCSRITVDRFSPPLVIQFLHDRPAARVEINSPFRLQVGTDSWRFDPESDRAALGPVLSLIERTVTLAVANEDGSLRLQFDGGAAIDVDCPEGVSEPWWFDMDDETEDLTPEP